MDKEKIIRWNGDTEEGLAAYLAWVLSSEENYNQAKKEIESYEE